jgi:hypothetical protein
VAEFIDLIGVARRTGRFPQLVDPRSGVNGHRVVPREILAILLGDRRGGDEQR